MDILKIAQEIERRIRLLDLGRQELPKRAKLKAETMAEYERELSKTILRLRNEKVEWEGQVIENSPATLVEKIAKGMMWEKKLEADLAESSYKNAFKGVDILQAQLNGFQSIYRHLSEL